MKTTTYYACDEPECQNATEETTMRYQVWPIANENCDSLRTNDDDMLAYESDDLSDIQAWLRTAQDTAPYGVGVIDTEAGDLDLGRGFGVAIEAPENE